MKVVEGTKLAYAKCAASTPDGRTEECVATLPWGDAAMILMKVETRTAPCVNGCSCILRITARISSILPSMIVPMGVS